MGLHRGTRIPTASAYTPLAAKADEGVFLVVRHPPTMTEMESRRRTGIMHSNPWKLLPTFQWWDRGHRVYTLVNDSSLVQPAQCV